MLYFAGFTLNTADFSEKEDMYDEIIRLKKVRVIHKYDEDLIRLISFLFLCFLCCK